MSWPRWVVPNQCSADGGWTRSLLRADGSYGAIHGPMIAIRQKNAEHDQAGRGLGVGDEPQPAALGRCRRLDLGTCPGVTAVDAGGWR